MDEGTIRQCALMWALIARMNAIIIRVEGMKVANKEREMQGYALAYNEQSFIECQQEIEIIAGRLNIEI